MSTLTEIKAAVDKRPLQQQKRFLFFLTARLHDGRTVRVPPRAKAMRRGLETAVLPAMKGLPSDLSTWTKDRVRVLACR